MHPTRAEFRHGVSFYRNGRNPACLPHLHHVIDRKIDNRMVALAHKMTAEVLDSHRASLRQYVFHIHESLKYHPKAHWGQVSKHKFANEAYRKGLHLYVNRRRLAACSQLELLIPYIKAENRFHLKNQSRLYTVIADVLRNGTPEEDNRACEYIRKAVELDPHFSCAQKIATSMRIDNNFPHF